jgi:hypothetical protein
MRGRSTATPDGGLHLEANLALLNRLLGLGALVGRLAALDVFDVVELTNLFVLLILHRDTPENLLLHSHSTLPARVTLLEQ